MFEIFGMYAIYYFQFQDIKLIDFTVSNFTTLSAYFKTIEFK